MADSRVLTAAVGLAVSLAASALLWMYFETFLFFLFVPFVPFLFRDLGDDESRQPQPRECPQCGFQTLNDEYEYCPRDGRRLQKRRDGTTEQRRTDGWS
ncbi:hypothetical protein GRX03_16005 [Halovenus sp. WSH3]|uniref:Uncharacterized protein n=1 Tax=Halovenus carboxidivorans TaxID=2692199 RepID=A0A6B0TCH1_9EURY|nr:hypothetical protein [Halovenus carboxidivorans]MXR53102.1 hypothetical protein [Halovenus carboxidivorans]